MSSVQQSIYLTNKERLFQDDIESANDWTSKPFKKTTALTSSLSTILEDEEHEALTKDRLEKCVDEDEDDGELEFEFVKPLGCTLLVFLKNIII